MTRIGRSKGSVAGAVAGLLVLLTGLTASAQAPKAERPTYAVGDKWIRSDGAYDLIRVENGRYVFAADGGREVHLTRDLGVAKIVRAGQVLLELEPPPGLTWPLDVGQSGVAWLTLRSLDPQFGQSLVRLTWKVDAYQAGRVPAGVFKAFRIVQVLEPRFLAVSPQSRRLELTFWYAPAVQQLVRADGNDLSGLAFQAVALDRPVVAALAVALTDRKAQGRVATERITLTGKVTGGTGPLRIAVTVNGAEIARQQEPGTPGPGAPAKDVPLSVPVKLAPGRNTVIVTATDGAGVSRQEGRVLFYDKPAPAAPAAPPTPAPPHPPPPSATPPPAVTPAPPAAPPTTATPPPPPPPPPPAVPAPPTPTPPPAATPPAPAPVPPPARPPVVAPPAPTPAPAAPTPAPPEPREPSRPTAEPPRGPTPPPAAMSPPPAAPPATVVAVPPESAGRASAPFRVTISTPTNQARVEQRSVTFAAGGHAGATRRPRHVPRPRLAALRP